MRQRATARPGNSPILAALAWRKAEVGVASHIVLPVVEQAARAGVAQGSHNSSCIGGYLKRLFMSWLRSLGNGSKAARGVVARKSRSGWWWIRPSIWPRSTGGRYSRGISSLSPVKSLERAASLQREVLNKEPWSRRAKGRVVDLSAVNNKETGLQDGRRSFQVALPCGRGGTSGYLTSGGETPVIGVSGPTAAVPMLMAWSPG